ncbi:hypothetical protein IP70_19425 [alpha proteobacterium AAP38]|nr:hypothetical protein IP70_19425 [alpha proteobacterium AAP38]
MTGEETPIHMVGVATGQSRGAYLFGTLVIVVLMLLAGIAIFMMVTGLARLLPGTPYLQTYGLLTINSIAIPVMALVLHWLHRLRLSDLIAPGRRMDWGMMGRAALIFALPMLVQVGIGLWAGELRLSQTSLMTFLMLAPLSILLFGLQASAEELLFRGYLAQGAQLLFRHAVPASLLTAVLFTLVHEGSEAQAVWAMRAEIFCMALFLSWITTRFGRLEAAMGVHIINNVLFSFFVGSADLSFPDLTTRVDLDPPDLSGWADWGEFALYQAVHVGFFWLAGIRTGFIEKGWISRRAA